MLDAENKDPRDTVAAQVIPLTPGESPAYIHFRDILAAMGAMCEVCFKSATGGAAAIDVALPFDPAAVFVWNETALAWFWFLPTMTAANVVRQVTAGTLSKQTSNGITLGAKDSRKVTLGTTVQSNNDVLHVVAFGSRGLFGS